VRPMFRTISGPVPCYQTGSGCSTVFWVVIAIPLVIVALATSGIVSDVFWGLAALMGLLATINRAYLGWKPSFLPLENSRKVCRRTAWGAGSLGGVLT
jgi:hypothetical protein